MRFFEALSTKATSLSAATLSGPQKRSFKPQIGASVR